MSNFPWTNIRLEAVMAVIEPDELYWKRYYCRQYSELFSTPLPEVEKLPFVSVYQNVLEQKIEGLTEDRLMEVANEFFEGQEISQEEENEIQEQIAKWEKEYAKQQAKKKEGFSFDSMSGAHKFKRKKKLPEPKAIQKTFDLPDEEDEE